MAQGRHEPNNFDNNGKNNSNINVSTNKLQISNEVDTFPDRPLQTESLCTKPMSGAKSVTFNEQLKCVTFDYYTTSPLDISKMKPSYTALTTDNKFTCKQERLPAHYFKLIEEKKEKNNSSINNNKNNNKTTLADFHDKLELTKITLPSPPSFLCTNYDKLEKIVHECLNNS